MQFNRNTKLRRRNALAFESEINSAFQLDCESLLLKYEDLKTCSYEAFAKLWRETGFTLVYSNLENIMKMTLYVENCLFVAKKFLVFPKSTYNQVGALYLLYGLYYKQPFQHWCKIRLTIDEYRMLMGLIEEMKAEKNYEVLYIYAKLTLDRAFLYVAIQTPRELDWQPTMRTACIDDTFERKTTESAFDSLKNLVGLENNLLAEFQKTSREYEEMTKKCAVECRGFMTIPSTIVEDIQKLHDQMLGEGSATGFSSTREELIKKEKAVASRSAEDAIKSMAERRHAIKKKAMKTFTTTSRGRQKACVKEESAA